VLVSGRVHVAHHDGTGIEVVGDEPAVFLRVREQDRGQLGQVVAGAAPSEYGTAGPFR
jgi:hypothetical protein